MLPYDHQMAKKFQIARNELNRRTKIHFKNSTYLYVCDSNKMINSYSQQNTIYIATRLIATTKLID